VQVCVPGHKGENLVATQRRGGWPALVERGIVLNSIHSAHRAKCQKQTTCRPTRSSLRGSDRCWDAIRPRTPVLHFRLPHSRNHGPRGWART